VLIALHLRVWQGRFKSHVVCTHRMLLVEDAQNLKHNIGGAGRGGGTITSLSNARFAWML